MSMWPVAAHRCTNFGVLAQWFIGESRMFLFPLGNANRKMTPRDNRKLTPLNRFLVNYGCLGGG